MQMLFNKSSLAHDEGIPFKNMIFLQEELQAATEVIQPAAAVHFRQNSTLDHLSLDKQMAVYNQPTRHLFINYLQSSIKKKVGTISLRFLLGFNLQNHLEEDAFILSPRFS